MGCGKKQNPVAGGGTDGTNVRYRRPEITPIKSHDGSDDCTRQHVKLADHGTNVRYTYSLPWRAGERPRPAQRVYAGGHPASTRSPETF